MQFLQTLWDTIKNFPWLTAYFTVKYIFIGLSILIFAAFVILLPHVWKYKRKYNVVFKYRNEVLGGKPKIENEMIRQEWERVLRKAETAPPDSLVGAIVEADDLVDNVLKQMNIPGEHMADRLDELNPETTKSLERLWRAHRIKNSLINVPDFEITAEEAREVLKDYKTFMEEIGAL
ncbi:MAG: hypothetical protein Q8P01_03330 [bacterium]|nr:hypothetical protein [bacterium]